MRMREQEVHHPRCSVAIVVILRFIADLGLQIASVMTARVISSAAEDAEVLAKKTTMTNGE